MVALALALLHYYPPHDQHARQKKRNHKWGFVNPTRWRTSGQKFDPFGSRITIGTEGLRSRTSTVTGTFVEYCGRSNLLEQNSIACPKSSPLRFLYSDFVRPITIPGLHDLQAR
jgi:hypothetical protein